MIGKSRVQTLDITLIVVLPFKCSDRLRGPPSLLFLVSKLGTSGETSLLPLYVFMACTGETFTLPKSLRGSTRLVDQGCTNPGRYIAKANNLGAVVPNICGPSALSFLYVTLLTRKIFQVAPRFLENCPPPYQVNHNLATTASFHTIFKLHFFYFLFSIRHYTPIV